MHYTSSWIFKKNYELTYDLIKTRLWHSVHNSQEMFLLPQSYPIYFFFVFLKELVPVHRTASRISDILIRNQLALIKDEPLCH